MLRRVNIVILQLIINKFKKMQYFVASTGHKFEIRKFKKTRRQKKINQYLRPRTVLTKIIPFVKDIGIFILLTVADYFHTIANINNCLFTVIDKINVLKNNSNYLIKFKIH